MLHARWTRRGMALLAVTGCLRQAPRAADPALPDAEHAAPRAGAAPAPAAAPEPVDPGGPERPDEPSPRRVEQPWMSLAEWRRRFEQQLSAPGRERAGLVVLGDSIVEGWCQSAAFRAQFGERSPLALGIGGDQTQHLLWRIDRGILDGLAPRAAIVLIGVNNLGNGFEPAATARGVRAVVASVQAKLPATPLLLLAILPAGQAPDDGLRVKIDATNRELAALARPRRVRVASVGHVFLDAQGQIPAAQMADFLHPTASGYERLSSAVRPLLDAMLQPE